MRILHAPIEIAGQAALSAAGLRRIGHHSRTLTMPHAFGYQDTNPVRLRGRSRPLQLAHRIALAPWAIAVFDVIHYHNGSSLVPLFKHIDARVAKRVGRVVVIEVYGAEVRLPSIERERNPWYVPSPNDDDVAGRDRMKRWSEITDGQVIVADHFADDFLVDYFDRIEIVHQRVDIGATTSRPPDPSNQRPVVLHAPSNLAVKGTESVRAAVDALRERGRRFEYVEVTGVPASEVQFALARADLVVDQLRLGSHGVFAAEAMAAGKPVICHVSDHLRPTYPDDLPLIDANPATIESVLDDWIHRPRERHDVGVQSRAYAERVHDHVAVARRLEKIYESGG